MPIYVYECRTCNKSFEVEQRITADALTDCMLCSANDSVRRVIQPVAVSFKGAGFHINDYAANSGTPGASESPAEATPPVATTEAPSTSEAS